MADATQQGVIPLVAREGGVIEATELTFDERQEWLASMPEEERAAMIAALPMAVRMAWINEEREDLEERVKDQPVEGAEISGQTDEQIIVPGSEAPEDRAPDVGAELIASLTKERFAAEERANKLQIQLDDANAEIQRYYEKFGPLGS